MKQRKDVIFKISLLVLTLTIMIFLSIGAYADGGSNGSKIKTPSARGPYTLGFAIDHGTLSSYSAPDQTVGGAATPVTAYPANGYVFDGWYYDSVKLGASGTDPNGNSYTINGNTLTITNVQAAALYRAKTVKKATVTLKFVMDNGTVTTSSQTVEVGEAAETVIGTPDAGYELTGIYNGSTPFSVDEIGTDSSGNGYTVLGSMLTITNAQKDATYIFKTASTVKKKFTIAYIAKNGDTIYPSAEAVEKTNVLTWDIAGEYNEMQSFFAGADLNWEIPAGKKFSCWTNVADGKKYKPGDTINLTADTVLQAVFEDIKDKDPAVDDDDPSDDGNDNNDEGTVDSNNDDKQESSGNDEKDSTSKKTVNETSSKTPTTGDQNDMMIWFVLVLAGVGAVRTATVIQKRK